MKKVQKPSTAANRHNELVELAKAALNRVFSDTSVDHETTYESLKQLREECDVFMDATIKR